MLPDYSESTVPRKAGRKRMFDLRKLEFALPSSVSVSSSCGPGKTPKCLPTPAETQCPRITPAKVHWELESLPLPLGPPVGQLWPEKQEN